MLSCHLFISDPLIYDNLLGTKIVGGRDAEDHEYPWMAG